MMLKNQRYKPSFLYAPYTLCGPGQLSRYSDSTGWTVWGSNPGGTEISRTRLDQPKGPTSFL